MQVTDENDKNFNIIDNNEVISEVIGNKPTLTKCTRWEWDSNKDKKSATNIADTLKNENNIKWFEAQ